MLEDPLDKWIVTASLIVLGALIYSRYLENSKDVHELYLQSQSLIGSTRSINQSAIYKSNLLTYTGNLRTGLELRYDSYKLRNGNLRDVWQLAMINDKKKQVQNFFVFGKQEISYSAMNYNFKQINLKLSNLKVKEVAICCSIYHSLDIFLVVLACFINGISIHYFNSIPQENNSIDLIILKSNQLTNLISRNLGIQNILVVDEEEDEDEFDIIEKDLNVFKLKDFHTIDFGKTDNIYTNVYEKEHDQGYPYKQTINFQKFEYSQLNIISAIASNIKHLPLEAELKESDKLLTVIDAQSTNTLSINSNLNHLIKILSGFVIGYAINIQTQLSDSEVFKKTVASSKPTLLSINQSQLTHLIPLKETINQLSSIERLKFDRDDKFLTNGIFPSKRKLKEFKELRVCYCFGMIDQESLTTDEFNMYRNLTSSRFVIEKMFSGVLGNLTLTNYYDYRIFSSALKFCGGITQSLEMKLVNQSGEPDKGTSGEIFIRGYTIAKRHTSRAEQDGASDGFMPTGIVGKWGFDGCLYV